MWRDKGEKEGEKGKEKKDTHFIRGEKGHPFYKEKNRRKRTPILFPENKENKAKNKEKNKGHPFYFLSVMLFNEELECECN